MNKYLGSTPVVDLTGTPFEGFGPQDWALKYVEYYRQIDGGHHKQWVLDQIARILLGTPVEVELARWYNGKEEYHFSTGEPSEKYLEWEADMFGEMDENGYYEYGYDHGVAP